MGRVVILCIYLLLSGKTFAIDWRGLDPLSWLDFKTWKKRQLLSDEEAHLLILPNTVEEMGRVIHCIGECKLYRGKGFALARSRSLIREGDELRTGVDSYAWVLFWDGSLLRLSAESAVSFREFNVSSEGFFLFLRLDLGHIFLANRKALLISQENSPETDRIFLPLPIKNLDQEILADPHPSELRPTRNLITMTGGGLYGENFQMDIFQRPEGESFFEQRGEGFWGQFWPWGYHERPAMELQENAVYRSGTQSLELQRGPEFFFAKSHALLRRIPSVLTVREKWLTHYARPALQQGYRLWEGYGEGKEMNLRIKFLRGYLRQVETAYRQVVVDEQKRKRLPLEEYQALPPRYIGGAFRHYIREFDRQRELGEEW